MTPEMIEHAVTVKLKKYQDMEIILLEGHLILEQVINHLIFVHAIDSKRVESMKLGYVKKLELAMALCVLLHENEYMQLKEINRIRNKIAHELFFDKYHDDLKKWASSVLGYRPKTINMKRTYRNHVVKAFCFIAGVVIGKAKAIDEIGALSNKIK